MSRETKILLAVLAGAATGIAFVLFSLWFLNLRRRAGGLMNRGPRHARSRNTTGGTVDVQARGHGDRREHGLKVAFLSP